jgi:hypothetical protein
MNDWGGYVTIENTLFDRNDNCGSLIRNYKIELSASDVNNDYIESDIDEEGESY